MSDRPKTARDQILSRLEDARAFLSKHLIPTPLLAAPNLSARSGCDVYVKIESALPTGSFKPRGALYALRRALEENTYDEVVTASTGNHGSAVAYAAKEIGIPATVFVPHRSNARKVERIAKLGATIREAGNDLAESVAAVAIYVRDKRAYFLDDAVDPNIPVGTATIATEIFDQLSRVDRLYVPVGDTALIRGVAAVAKGRATPTRVIGVQAERAPSYYDSWRVGAPRRSRLCDTIADGLATARPLPNNVAALRELVDDMQLVSEHELFDAIRLLWTTEEVESEPAGAAAVAALLKDIGKRTGEVVVCIVTGSNIADEVREQALGPSIRCKTQNY